MRRAPPVSVRCSGGSVWPGLMVAAPTLSAAALALWAAGHAGFTPGASLSIALALALAVAVLARWRLPADGAQLVWDGQAWQVDGQGGCLAVMMDLGPWLLLRLQPAAPGRVVWVPVAAVQPRAAWHGLRAALYCRVPTVPTVPPGTSPQSE